MWVEVVVGSGPCFKGFSLGCLVLLSAMDWYPIQGGVEYSLSSLHAMETGISSAVWATWLSTDFTLHKATFLNFNSVRVLYKKRAYWNLLVHIPP